jgi:predicted aspartyl protease
VRAAHALSVVAFVLALALSLTLAGGCIGSQVSAKTAANTDLSLTAVALSVDTGFSGVVIACKHAEGVALERAETQEELDAAFAVIREKCDKASAAFELARIAVVAATQSAARLTSGEITEADYLGLLSNAIFAGAQAAAALRKLQDDLGEP